MNTKRKPLAIVNIFFTLMPHTTTARNEDKPKALSKSKCQHQEPRLPEGEYGKKVQEKELRRTTERTTEHHRLHNSNQQRRREGAKTATPFANKLTAQKGMPAQKKHCNGTKVNAAVNQQVWAIQTSIKTDAAWLLKTNKVI